MTGKAKAARNPLRSAASVRRKLSATVMSEIQIGVFSVMARPGSPTPEVKTVLSDTAQKSAVS
ncbi:MAG: hypothetical protein RSE34_01895, partial [Brevundimonas sp.]